MLQRMIAGNVRAIVEDPQFSRPEPLTIDGLDGMKITARGNLVLDGVSTRITYIAWSCMRNGIGWRLVSWAPTVSEAKLNWAWKSIPQCFRILDRDRVIRTSDEFSIRLRSDRFGVKADLAGTQFFLMPKIMAEPEDSRLIAIGAGESYFGVYPYALPDDRPSRKTVVESLLSVFNANVEDARLHAKLVRHGSLDAIEYRERGTGDEPHRQRFFRICMGDSHVWMIHSDADARDKGAVNAWELAVERVKFDPPESVSFDQFLKIEQDRHSAFYLALGTHCLRSGQLERLTNYTLLAQQVNPDDLTVYEEVVDRLLATRQFSKVMPLLEVLPAGIAFDPERKAHQAWTLSEVGRNDEALAKYEALFRGGYDRIDHQEHYLRLLSGAGRSDDAIEIIDRLIESSPSVDLIIGRAELLVAGKRTDEALAYLRRHRDESPLASDEYSIALVDALLQVDEDREALNEVLRLERSGQSTLGLLLSKGIAQFKLERFTESRQSFEATLDEVPDLPFAKQFLTIISARLGQGDVSAVEEPLVAVPLPADVTRLNPRPVSMKDDDNYWIALDARSIAFQPGEEYRTTRTQVIHVLDRNAVELFSRLQFDFDSLAEKFYVNRAEVYDEKGLLIASTNARDCFVLATEDDGLATNQKTLNVPLAGLRPGCRIEYQVTWQRHTAPQKFPGLRFETAKYSPTSRVVVFVSGDLSTLRWTGPQPTRTADGVLWDMSASRRTNENMIDDLAIPASTICLGNSEQSWQQVGQGYFDDIQDRLVVSPAARKLVKEILANSAMLPVSKRVDRLAEWVRNELTYQGIEFGRRAWLMPPVEDTLRNRYGDCKDHSLLLWQLLQAADIKTHLALINVGEAVELRLPSSDQFDHMIVYVEDELGERFIDCTDKNIPGSVRVPMGLALKVALVLDADTSRLARLPDYPDDYNRVWINRAVTLSSDGTAEINETLWFDGYMASFMRRIMTSVDREGQESIVRSLLPATMNSRISDLHFENPTDLSEQPILRVKYTMPHYVTAVPKQLIGRIELLNGIGGVTAVGKETRQQPFRLRMPLDTSATIRITTPEGFSVVDLPKQQVVQTPVLDAVCETSTDDDALEMRIRIRRRTARLQPSSWTNWRKTCQQVDDLLTLNLILKR